LHLVGILFPQIVNVASSWFFYITLPTLIMHGQTQIKIRLKSVNEA